MTLCTSVDKEIVNLAGSRDSLSVIAQAITHVRMHDTTQILCEEADTSRRWLVHKDFQGHLTKTLRTLLDDVQLQGERIDFEIEVSKTNILIITLRREEPSKDDTPVPPSV